MARSITEDEHAGAVEPFRDPALYDWEFRRRRHDVAFYRMLADECGGPILDLGCGTGRMTIPLTRDGHRVVGVDLSASMLGRAAKRLQRVARTAAGRCLLVRGDLRQLPVRGRFKLAIAAFHTVQHLIDDEALISMFRGVRRLIAPDGWFAFDVFFPHAKWLGRPQRVRFDRTVFHHPVTGQKLVYTFSHRLDSARRALHMRFFYQRLAEDGSPVGRERTVRLCHRQLPPDDVDSLLRRSGLKVLARWSGFEGQPLTAGAGPAGGAPSESEQHVYLVGPDRRAARRV